MTKVKLRMTMLVVLSGLVAGACGGGSDSATKIEPAALEDIDGSEVSRVILTQDAANRIDITTAQVRLEEVVRKRQFGAEVVTAPAGALPGSAFWVQVLLTDSEKGSVDLTETALVYPLADSVDGDPSGFTARAASGVGDPGDANGSIFYSVTAASSISPGTPVLIEVPLASRQSLILPYGAVVYDPQGQTWTYTNPEPLVYVRHPITIEYIDGGEAFLSEGPPPGTEVVTVGAGELSGFEAGVGK